MTVPITKMTRKDIAERRREIQQIVDESEFQERRDEGDLTFRDRKLLEELQDLEFLAGVFGD
ncbi:hypothetical protein A4H34_00355 [Peptidiphaga gingivicola]|mgnify:FL=1|jgi:hypothetical protein|uniref:Uncharacterized protein n=2 Tax=Peptidiphaga gingivicola TaxID=2741497 RepID=A0A179B2S3_9ACTO|nr:hypothetical protein A4H34_00355 [Peptidiphaga gingivicola]